MCLTWDATMSLREDIPISRETPAAPSSPRCCFPIWSRTRPLSPRPGTAMPTCHGARTTCWTDSRRSLPARTSEPQHRSHTPPAAFPVGYAAGGGISYFQRLAAPPPLPRHLDPGGPTPPRPSPIDPSNSHRTILKGPINETPPASPISTRSHHPQRVSAPRPAHAETPTPRN